MAEAIYSRLRFTFLLGMFFLPIIASVWNRYIEAQVEQVQYLSVPGGPTWQAESASNDASMEVANLAEPDDAGIFFAE